MKRMIAITVIALVCMAFTLSCGTVRAQDYSPQVPDDQSAGQPTGNTFNWMDIPSGQQIPVRSATFSQDGYTLVDTVGETIIVPFNNNLYVMKFAVSPDGTEYFKRYQENAYSDSTPTLYLPSNGYLDNATVPGARWYPFTPKFQPDEPVYMGIAPSWNDYATMGWYPGMYCYGGYHRSDIGILVATMGLLFLIDHHQYYGWDYYHRFYQDHPRGFQRMGHFRSDVFRSHPTMSRNLGDRGDMARTNGRGNARVPLGNFRGTQQSLDQARAGRQDNSRVRGAMNPPMLDNNRSDNTRQNPDPGNRAFRGAGPQIQDRNPSRGQPQPRAQDNGNRSFGGISGNNYQPSPPSNINRPGNDRQTEPTPAPARRSSGFFDRIFGGGNQQATPPAQRNGNQQPSWGSSRSGGNNNQVSPPPQRQAPQAQRQSSPPPARSSNKSDQQKWRK